MNADPQHADATADAFESALAATQADAEGAIRANAGLNRELKRAKTAAATGAIRDLEKSLAAAEQLGDALRDSVRALRAGWGFDERAHLESGAYTEELLRTARERGVELFEQDGLILSFPSLVRVLPGDAAVEIDRKREKRIRPSVLAERLRAGQQKPPRFKPEPFLEALHDAYRLALKEKGLAEGASVQLLDIYRILTLFPGQSRDYSKQEFTRDIYLLDRSGVERTRSGHRVALPAASGTRTGAVLRTVTREGELKPYFAISFRA